MAFIILDATPATAVATNGTISFALPSGVAAGDLLDAGAKLWVEGHEALYSVGASNFSFTKASPIVLTYLGATSIPAGTKVRLQVELNPLAVTVTATADGTGTGVVPDTATFVNVTSGNADHIVTLPTPRPGAVVRLKNGGTGYELRTTDPATIAINGGSGAGAESAIGANVLVTATCTSPTTWVCMNQAAAGTVSATEVAA